MVIEWYDDDIESLCNIRQKDCADATKWELQAEAGAENLLLEFFGADTENRISSEEEMQQSLNTEENIIMQDWESELERMVLREALVTDPDLFYELEAELVRNIEMRTDLWKWVMQRAERLLINCLSSVNLNCFAIFC